MGESGNRKHDKYGEKSTERQILNKTQKDNRKRIKTGKHLSKGDLFTDLLRIPADVSERDFRITITGKSHVWVENYRSILEYSDKKMVLQGNKNKLCIEGENLCIDYYTGDDMMIKGLIECIQLAE